MFNLYLTLAYRSLLKQKGYSAMNIFGLALGIASCLLITLYVSHEKSYDRWINNYENIHRVAIDITAQNGDHLLFAPITPMAAVTLSELSQTEVVTRIFKPFEAFGLISDGKDKKIYETGFSWADENIFKVFDYPFIAGNPSTALLAPNTMVITRSIAKKYFNPEQDWSQVLNESLMLNNKVYQITGVLEDIPVNSSYRPDFIASMREFDGRRMMTNWHSTMFQTFVRFKEGTDLAQTDRQISRMADKFVGEEIKNNQQEYRFFLQPLASIHLHSDLRYELSKNNSATYLNIFLFAAVFILLIACFNFVNLTTAMARQRSKEVGVRKVIGAQRKQLILQYFAESFLICLISSVFAFLFVQFSLPWFNTVAFKQLTITDLYAPVFLFSALGIVLLTAVISGIYPAVVLSGYSPIMALTNRFLGGNSSGTWLRSGLVVLQFTISMVIIISTLVISSQLRYLQTQDTGFDKEQLLIINAPGGGVLREKFKVLREEFEKHHQVQEVSVTGSVPGRPLGNNLVTLKSDKSKSTDMQLMQIDENFLSTYKIPILAGRNISERLTEDTTGDEQGVLINEAALAQFGWNQPEEAIGQVFGGGWGKVIGVIKNFNFNSLQSKIVPLELYYDARSFEYLTLKLKTEDLPNTLASLESTWKGIVDSHPFEYFFLDEDYNKQYVFEQRMKSLFSGFSLTAILIACLGLFGLSTYTIFQRTKEIGMRKVLGASVTDITGLLSRDFLKWVLSAVLLSIPLGWWAMTNWLNRFAYRIELTAGVFVLAGILALFLSFITIFFQAFRASVANPITSLRSE